jgi:hypothetical protein
MHSVRRIVRKQEYKAKKEYTNRWPWLPFERGRWSTKNPSQATHLLSYSLAPLLLRIAIESGLLPGPVCQGLGRNTALWIGLKSGMRAQRQSPWSPTCTDTHLTSPSLPSLVSLCCDCRMPAPKEKGSFLPNSRFLPLHLSLVVFGWCLT